MVIEHVNSSDVHCSERMTEPSGGVGLVGLISIIPLATAN